MKEDERKLVEAMQREAAQRVRAEPRPPLEPRTIQYTELPEAKPDSPLYHDWTAYRREVGRLLAEGHEGQFVLIKGEEIIGIWKTREEAEKVAVQNYLWQPCLIQQIRSQEPLIRTPGWFCQCHSYFSQSVRLGCMGM